jgi:DNA-binding response OmpR family regulator
MPGAGRAGSGGRSPTGLVRCGASERAGPPPPISVPKAAPPATARLWRLLMDSFRVLLVEDDPAIVEIAQLGLTYEHAEVVVAVDGVEALRLYEESDPDIVLLDIMLPGLDGFDVLRAIRAQGDTPVILLTAKSAPEDRVRGLDAGADDYVSKPFHFAELVSRIRAVLRRQGTPQSDVLSIGDLRIQVGAHKVSRGGEPIDVTARQFALLEYLVRHAGRVVSKEEIYEAVWGWTFLGNRNVVEQHISNLRGRVEQDGWPRLIHTVRGVGYVLREEE